MKTSSLFTIDWKDAGKGFLVAALTGGLTVLYDALIAPDGLNAANLKKAGIAALAGGIAYLIKNFFTDATVKTPTDENKA